MRTRVIALANQKGGVGKTTTAINLAAYLAVSRRRVLLIDMDPQCNATRGLGVEPAEGHSVYGAMLAGEALADCIRPTSLERLDLIASELDLAGAEVDVARSDRYLHRFADALGPLLAGTRYDFVFVDCPPSLGILAMNALTAADSVLIPIQCEYYALEGLTVISRLVSQLREGGANPRLEIEGIVMTMYDGRTNLAEQVVNEVRSHFADKVYAAVIPRSVRLSEAPSFGLPIVGYDKHSAGAKAYKALASEFLKRCAARERPPAPPPPPAGQTLARPEREAEGEPAAADAAAAQAAAVTAAPVSLPCPCADVSAAPPGSPASPATCG